MLGMARVATLGGIGMTRIVVAACCALALGGCTSWLPSLDFTSGGYVAELVLESEPAGAEARTSQGPACRTPCRLAVEARGGFSVTFSREGYLPQSVPVQVRQPGDSRFDPGAPPSLQLTPNPVAVVLEPAPAPPPKRKPVKRRPAPKPVAAAPAQPAAAAAASSQPVPAPTAATAAPRTLPTTMSPQQPGATVTPVAPARTN
jgi:hypothetical protein